MVIAFHLRVGYVIYSCILPFLRIAGLPFTFIIYKESKAYASLLRSQHLCSKSIYTR